MESSEFLLSPEADVTLLLLHFSCCLSHCLLTTKKCTSQENSLSDSWSTSEEQSITDTTTPTVVLETGFPEKLEGQKKAKSTPPPQSDSPSKMLVSVGNEQEGVAG